MSTSHYLISEALKADRKNGRDSRPIISGKFAIVEKRGGVLPGAFRRADLSMALWKDTGMPLTPAEKSVGARKGNYGSQYQAWHMLSVLPQAHKAERRIHTPLSRDLRGSNLVGQSHFTRCREELGEKATRAQCPASMRARVTNLLSVLVK